MSRYPDDVKYTRDHLWVRTGSGPSLCVGAVGQRVEEMGPLAGVDLPAAGSLIEEGGRIGRVIGSDDTMVLVAPVGGIVSRVNQAVLDDPALASRDAWGEGWLFEVEVAGEQATTGLGLLDAEAYAATASAQDAS